MSIKIPIVLLAFVSFACAPPRTSETSQDSTATAAADTTLPRPAASAPVQELVPSDTSLFDRRYSVVSQAVADSSDSYFQVSVSTDQYEASSTVTWYFDESFSPRYFKETWSMEGTEGSTEYFIEDNKVICALVDESYGSGSSSTQWCDRTGGIKSTWKDDGTDPEKALVADDFANTCKDGLARYIEILKRLLKEGKITEEDNNVVTVRLESTVNVGFEAKQSTEVRINRALYDQLN